MPETVTQQGSESFHRDLLQYTMSSSETLLFDLSSLTSSQHFEKFMDCIIDEPRSPFGVRHADAFERVLGPHMFRFGRLALYDLWVSDNRGGI